MGWVEKAKSQITVRGAWLKVQHGCKNLVIAHGKVRDGVKGWERLVTHGMAWHPVSHTGAAQSGVGNQRQSN